MAQQRRTRGPWVLSAMTPAIVLLLSCAPVESPEESTPSVLSEPPTAVAPPDSGVAPPPVELPAPEAPPVPLDARPQQQLTGWSEAMSDELNIPRTALEAYGYATRALETSMPQCGMSWPVLAGIGAVESGHGRFGGAKLDETARPSISIRGLPLDGGDGVKRIEDTDRGVLDGDIEFDRAIGPLQFIPETWQEWGADADADGVASADDLDDAALAAGTYLCTVGGDLRQPEQFWKALLTYNQSRSYGQEVLDRADHYGKVSRNLSGQR